MKHFMLVGNPNSGKTTLFNNLTGSTAHVGNWPGVTVEKRSGIYKKRDFQVDIIDLPGIYSLSPYTPEEVISRNAILNDKPDCVINIVDATNLERNLYLTTQLLEMDVPIIVALNMIDIVNKNGDKINVKALEKELGVPVVEISALKDNNIDKLMEKAVETSEHARKGTTVLQDSALVHLIKDIEIAFKGKKVFNPLFHAIKLIENDELETMDHPDLIQMVDEYKSIFKDDTFGNDFEALVADARYKYISKNFSPALKKKNVAEKSKNLTISDKIDKILTNRWAGIPIFIAILFVIFHLVFSEDFLFFEAMGLFNNVNLNHFVGTSFEGLFASEHAINSPGVILANLVNGLTGLINSSVANGLESLNAEPWVSGIICDGILGGVFAVIGFLPQILLLFLFFSILEDSGYMARVAFILDRLLRKFGVSGRAFMPMIMGFGCSVPAMINTRTLASEKEKIATIRVIPFFSCGAKLPILTAVAGGMAIAFNIPNADIVTLGMYLLGMIVAFIALILMRNTTMRGDVPPFIMELPSYHLPQFKSLMIHLWDKLKHFVKKAFTIILLSTIVVWLLQHITRDWRFLAEDQEMGDSILASLGMLIQPLFTPLGFGSQLANYGWVFAVAAITGLIAKENCIGTISVLALSLGATGFEADGDGILAMSFLINQTGITAAGAISFIAFNMLTIPCFAAVATARAELKKGTLKWTILFWLIASYLVSSTIYLVGTWWWTIFIVLLIIVLLIIGVYYYNKFKKTRIMKI